MITIKDVQAAHERMKSIIHGTAIQFSQTFSNISGNSIYLKLENFQKTGSFKVRGSFNKIMSLTEEEKSRGVIAASAGNHAQGVAYASSIFNINCTIVMPKGAPLSKIEATESYGANIILHGDVFDDALAYALQLKEETGATFVHPYDDEGVIMGQGTIALEILEKMPDVDVVLCPVGGGGLLAGISAVLKQHNPAIQVYGVESLACPGMSTAIQKNKPVVVNSTDTIADGISVRKPGELTYEYVSKYVDGIVCVEEAEISRTMLYLLERNKMLVEGAGACSVAAIVSKKLPFRGKKIVCIISGGNTDVTLLSRIIERGLVESGRFVTFSTVVSDKPGHLSQLLRIMAEAEANVISVDHQRVGNRVMLGQAEVVCSIETKNRAHMDKIYQTLIKEGYAIRILD